MPIDENQTAAERANTKAEHAAAVFHHLNRASQLVSISANKNAILAHHFAAALHITASQAKDNATGREARKQSYYARRWEEDEKFDPQLDDPVILR